MGGKPFQSSLIPYQEEIARLRSEKPPVSYARIAALLAWEHGLNIQRAAIAKFVKARSGGRRVYFFRKEVAARKTAPVRTAVQTGPPDCNRSVRTEAERPSKTPAQSDTSWPPIPKFDHVYSERYNLKRLPEDVAAAIRKKLEAEGH